MVLPKYHMIKFTEWMEAARARAEAVPCPKCGEPTSKAELNAYNGECENCWNNVLGYAPPMTNPEPKGGRRVIHKPGIFGG